MLDAPGYEALGAERLAACLDAGVDWVQVRERERSGEALVALVDAVVAIAHRHAARAIVNRRIDVALACAADGVHLGFDAVDAATARELLGSDALVGVSCHAPDEVTGTGPASYAHLAPIYAPLSKPATRVALGPRALRRASRSLPVLAQGGIRASNAAGCLAAGAAGVAVTGEILGAGDPPAAARALRAALDGG